MNKQSTNVMLSLIQRNKVLGFYKRFVIDSIMIARRSGIKELVRQRGRKFLFIIISYYLVRDTLAYLVIPYFTAQGIL